jgi:hypothetical protein
VHELGPREYQGMRLFLDYARRPAPAGDPESHAV